MRDNERQSAIILSVIGIVPVVWLALLIAPSVKGGLPEILPSLMNVFNNPFHIEVCEDSVKTVLILLLCYEWVSGYISPHSETTAGGRNTVLQNGAVQEPWIRSTDSLRTPITN